MIAAISQTSPYLNMWAQKKMGDLKKYMNPLRFRKKILQINAEHSPSYTQKPSSFYQTLLQKSQELRANPTPFYYDYDDNLIDLGEFLLYEPEHLFESLPD